LHQLFIEHCDFWNIDIARGSVATYLRCGGIFKCEFVANLSLSLSVKKIENQSAFGEVMGKSLMSCFLTHGVVYADDTALLLPSATDATTSLKSFSESASHLGLDISSSKAKIQNIGSGPKPPDISLDGNVVESVDSIVYLGSLQSSDGQCRPDLTRRIGLACAVMTSLKRIWSDRRLTLDTKLRSPYIPDTCFVCITIRRRHLDVRPTIR